MLFMFRNFFFLSCLMPRGFSWLGPNIPEKIEAELVADAIACLAFPYDSQARANTVTRLTSGLTIECREEDDFTTAISQRLHFLKCMHAAMR